MKVLVTTSSFGKVDKRPLDLLAEAGHEVTVNPYGRKLSIEESKELLPGYDALIAGTEKINLESLSTTSSLQYICRLGAGMDSVDFNATKERNIKVENTPSAHVDGVAELSLWGMLSCLRSAAQAHHNLRTDVWKKPMGSLLKDKKVGIIGLGQVGKRMVALLKPFNVSILANDAYPDTDFAQKNNVTLTSIENVLSECDIISIHVPFTPDNKYLLDTPQFALLKENAVVLNVSRGGLVNEEALCQFLKKNEKAAAYLDTFEQEPYNGPLQKVSNCVLTPHIGSYASEVRIAMELEAATKVIQYFNG